MRRRSPQSLVLAIDLGSSSVRSALFTETGAREEATMGSRHYAIRYAADGAAELDAALLRGGAKQCIAATLRARSTELHGLPITAVSGSAFWHGLLGLGNDGQPLTPIYTWADSRSKAEAAQLRRELSERAVQCRTGCMLRAQFWPAKLRWLERADRKLYCRVARWTSPASWIFHELFGAAGTSHSMASATGLYNLRERGWDGEMCRACSVRPEQLDAITDRASRTKPSRLVDNAIIFSAIGDGAAGNLGSGADAEGVVAINLGTSGAVRLIRQTRRDYIPLGLFQYVVGGDRMVIGGAISNAGNLHQWCLRELRLEKKEAEEALSREAAASDLLTVLPFWVQERARTRSGDLSGTISGLTQTTTASDLIRAASTSAFYRLAAILESLESVEPAKQIIVSGGILDSLPSLRILADCLGRDVRVCREPESSLRGAAVYALQHLGCVIKPLRAGRLIRHHAVLAQKHRRRRSEQNALEQRLR